MRLLRAAALVACLTCMTTAPALAQNVDFDGFRPKKENLPKSYKKVKPFGGIDAKVVHAFSISGGKCASGNFKDGSGKGDCDYGSVRSELREKKRGKGLYSAFPQPDPAWYGFDLLIPRDYPTKGQQTAGFNIFAQWKSERCPQLAIAHWTRPSHDNALFLFLTRAVGDWNNHDCDEVATKKIIGMNAIKGRWTRIELYVDWSAGSDGGVDVYVNGKRQTRYRGPTLDPDNRNQKGRASNKNYFSYGTYLSGTKGVRHVKPGTVYFANMRRARSRDGLR